MTVDAPPRQRYGLIFERAVSSPPPDVIVAHRRRLAELHARGVVVMAGPFEGGGGLVIFDVSSFGEAEEIARADPFVVQATHRYLLVRWLQDVGLDAANSPPAAP